MYHVITHHCHVKITDTEIQSQLYKLSNNSAQWSAVDDTGFLFGYF